MLSSAQLGSTVTGLLVGYVAERPVPTLLLDRMLPAKWLRELLSVAVGRPV